MSFPGEIDRLLGLMEANNLGLMNLVYHLLTRTAFTDDNQTVVTEHDLQVLDRYIAKPDEVFPFLKDLI